MNKRDFDIDGVWRADMRRVLVHNRSAPHTRPLLAKYCQSFWCRLRGLSFRGPLPVDEGLLLVQNRDSRLDATIHMLGVWMDLGVVWVNAAGVVMDVRLARRWRLAYVPQRPARYVLEISPARLEDFKVGDEVYFEDTPLD